jgi:hypothetical protein
MRNLAPQYAGQPVILIHLSEGDPSFAACGGGSYVLPAPVSHPDTPRVLCPLCWHAVMRQEARQ